MASGKGFFLNALGGMVLRQGQVCRVRDVSPRFRWVSVQGDALRNIDWTPGDKVQVLLPTLDVRTFTPMTWDRKTGTTEFLLYRNQPATIGAAEERPGTHFIAAVREGDACRFVGPQRSLAVAADTPTVLFGDETSFAVARALSSSTNKTPACVFEVNARSECKEVLAELGLPDAICIERREGDAHLVEVNERLQTFLSERQGARLLMTGCAQTIQDLRARRRSAGQSRADKTKAYWSLGKAGLD